MAGTNFRGAYEFDPETYDSQNAGGLLGRLLATVQPNQNLPGNNSDSNPIGATQFDSGDYSPQGGLLGRLLALQSDQSRYQQSPDSSGQATFATQLPNVMQGPTSSDNPAPGQQAPPRRVYIYAPMQHDAPTTPAPGGRKGRSIPRTLILRMIPKPIAVRVACLAGCAHCKRSKASISQHLVTTCKRRTRTSDRFHPGHWRPERRGLLLPMHPRLTLSISRNRLVSASPTA